LPGLRNPLPFLEQAPGAQVAVEWLINPGVGPGPRPNSSRAWRRRRALQHFIVKEDGESWQVKAHALERMVKSAIRRSSAPPRDPSALLCGLGELAVRGRYKAIRTEYDIEPFIRRWLARHRRKIRWRTILTQAAALNRKWQKEMGLRDLQREAESMGIAQHLLSHQTLTPELWRATQPMRYGHSIPPSMRYGLRFTARLALALDPAGLMRWLRTDADPAAQWVVIEMLQDIVLWSGSRAGRQAGSLLATKDPLGTVLAARMLVDPPLRGPAPPLAESSQKMLGAGLSQEEVCWLCSPAIGVADDRHREALSRFEYLERQREGLGAPDPAKPVLNAEIARIDGELVTATAHKSGTVEAIAASQMTFAHMLRHTLIGQTTWELIVQELPNQHGLRHELALAIGEGEARRRLLERNLRDFLTEIGGDRPEEAFQNGFSIKKETFFGLADGAVQAMIVLAADMSKTIGQFTGQRIAPLAKAAGEALAEPYLQARHYTRWRSALGRYACAVILAFCVADALTEDRRSEVTRLVDQALGHARTILSQVPEPFEPAAWWFQHLSRCAVRWLDLQGCPGKVEALALDETQPFLTRSMAFWARPDLAAKHIDLALECFKVANTRWPGEMAMPERAIRAVLALDIAVGCCGADGVADRLIPIWDDIFASWRNALERDWLTLPKSLILAIRGVEPCRSRLLGDKRFSPSFCRLTIERGGVASEAENEVASG
jgi:hypothetical protein